MKTTNTTKILINISIIQPMLIIKSILNLTVILYNQHNYKSFFLVFTLFIYQKNHILLIN